MAASASSAGTHSPRNPSENGAHPPFMPHVTVWKRHPSGPQTSQPNQHVATRNDRNRQSFQYHSHADGTQPSLRLLNRSTPTLATIGQEVTRKTHAVPIKWVLLVPVNENWRLNVPDAANSVTCMQTIHPMDHSDRVPPAFSPLLNCHGTTLAYRSTWLPQA